jgi:hypothetical protein
MLLSELETLFSLIPTCTLREDKFGFRYYKITFDNVMYLDGTHYDDILRRDVNTRFRLEGEGSTPDEATDALCNDASGKTIVVRGEFFKLPECFIRDDYDNHNWKDTRNEAQRAR